MECRLAQTRCVGFLAVISLRDLYFLDVDLQLVDVWFNPPLALGKS